MTTRTTIRGEKVFTPKVRRRLVYRCLALFKKLQAQSYQVLNASMAIAGAKNDADLEKIARSPAASILHLSFGDFQIYFKDFRETCSYCGRKSHGGFGVELLGKRRFGCWRKACQKRMDLEIQRDKKLHPQRWRKRKKYDRYGSQKIRRRRSRSR